MHILGDCPLSWPPLCAPIFSPLKFTPGSDATVILQWRMPMLRLRVFRMPPPTKVMMQRHSAVYQCCELLTTANSKLYILLSLIAFFVFLLQCWFYKEATLATSYAVCFCLSFRNHGCKLPTFCLAGKYIIQSCVVLGSNKRPTERYLVMILNPALTSTSGFQRQKQKPENKQLVTIQILLRCSPTSFFLFTLIAGLLCLGCFACLLS